MITSFIGSFSSHTRTFIVTPFLGAPRGLEGSPTMAMIVGTTVGLTASSIGSLSAPVLVYPHTSPPPPPPVPVSPDSLIT